ncbi:MAG: hypothetical protein KGN84_02210 [Acidobacteriota bacterium]|nr:hypothetical protein [Acidobacteriota bacterium]
MTTLLRVAGILVAAIAFMALTTCFERTTQVPAARFAQSRESRKREPGPRPSRFPQVFAQLVLYVLLAVTGRYILRLRL